MFKAIRIDIAEFRYFGATIFVVLLGSICVWSQIAQSSDRVNVETKLLQSKTRVGSSATAQILLKIEKDWHIQSHDPTFTYLIGTSVVVTAPKGITTSSIRYPIGKRVKFEFSKKPLSVYEDSTKIVVVLKVASTLRAGDYSVPTSIRVQACNDAVCLPPSNIQTTIPLKVSGAR